MRAKTIQVVWHGKEPVYSLDFHPSGSLITGGADKEVKVWKVRGRAPCVLQQPNSAEQSPEVLSPHHAPRWSAARMGLPAWSTSPA